MLLKSIGLGRAVRDPRAPSQTHGHAHVLYVLYPRAAKQHVYPARGRANIFCIVPSLTDDPRRESDGLYVLYDTYTRGNTCGNMCALQNTLWHHVRDLSLSLTHTHTHTHTRTHALAHCTTLSARQIDEVDFALEPILMEPLDEHLLRKNSQYGRVPIVTLHKLERCIGVCIGYTSGMHPEAHEVINLSVKLRKDRGHTNLTNIGN